MSDFDCMKCGACCVNPETNRREGYVDYVEVKPRDTIRRRPELLRRFTVVNDEGQTHLRLDVHQRCAALRGKLGREVRCEIYAFRPAGCRRVEAGSPGCLQARSERGIGT
ncbi:MAG TPA: YkgJ family cysteine cluster protein [Polyangiaceae bacterium]|jgi:Fe-S-cluster containining protein